MMFRFRCLVTAVAVGLFVVPRFALGAQSVGLALAQSSNCLSCHQVERKVVGPGFSVIAERFQGSSGAVQYLAQSIVTGSKGKWGPVPMPRQAHVSEADAKVLAQWILSLNEDPEALDDLLGAEEAAN